MFKECIISKSYHVGLVLRYQKFISENHKYKEINYKIEVQYIGYNKDFEIMKQEWFFKHPTEAMAKFKYFENKLDKLIIKF